MTLSAMKLQNHMNAVIRWITLTLAVAGPGIQFADAQALIDKKATKETKALYANLFRIAEQGFMFGHRDTDA